jgi:hypothetical protein
MLTTSEWAVQQWADVNLGDQRLNRRALEMGRRMAAHPEASLPEQMGEPKMLKGAYGLLNHPGVDLAALLAPHRQQTLAQAAAQPIVLFVEDTTELDFTAHPKMQGVARIGNDRGQGLLLHSTLALVPQTRDLLGLAHSQVLLRAPKLAKRPKWVRTPEGLVWEVSAQQVGRPTQDVLWVHVSDGASDIFEYMATCRALDKHFLVRASHNRVLPEALPDPQDYETQIDHLLDFARRLPPAEGSAYTLTLPAEGQRPARQAVLALQWAQVTLPPSPQAPAAQRQRAPLTVWVLRAWEPDPPAAAEPVEWILLSSLPILSLADAQQRIDWYRCRWFCEDFHQCLKTGCRIERSQLDDGADVARLLGFALPIAVRLLQLRQAARNVPDAPATSLIEPLMVRVLAQHRRTDWQTMTVAAFWRSVALLGGHQGRKGDGPPGWRTVWRGWHRLSDWTDGARLFAETAPP